VRQQLKKWKKNVTLEGGTTKQKQKETIKKHNRFG
jgi:hypothetical protein